MMTVQDDGFMAKTPSPFLHPAHAPSDLLQMQPLPGYDLPGNGMNIAFGDIPADFSLSGFDEENVANYTQGMMYDPASGMYVTYDWQMPYNQGCYPMMGDMQGGLPEDFQIGGLMPMQQNGGNGNAEQLLAALSEKLAAGKGNLPEGADGAALYGGPAYGENGLPVPDAMGGACDVMAPEGYMGPLPTWSLFLMLLSMAAFTMTTVSRWVNEAVGKTGTVTVVIAASVEIVVTVATVARGRTTLTTATRGASPLAWTTRLISSKALSTSLQSCFGTFQISTHARCW